MKILLCNARHAHEDINDLPAIFPQVIVDPSDTEGMYSVVYDAIHETDHSDGIDLYVTGMTVAVGAVVRYCYKNGIALTLWHYDRSKDAYYPQRIFTPEDAFAIRWANTYEARSCMC